MLELDLEKDSRSQINARRQSLQSTLDELLGFRIESETPAPIVHRRSIEPIDRRPSVRDEEEIIDRSAIRRRQWSTETYQKRSQKSLEKSSRLSEESQDKIDGVIGLDTNRRMLEEPSNQLFDQQQIDGRVHTGQLNGVSFDLPKDPPQIDELSIEYSRQELVDPLSLDSGEISKTNISNDRTDLQAAVHEQDTSVKRLSLYQKDLSSSSRSIYQRPAISVSLNDLTNSVVLRQTVFHEWLKRKEHQQKERQRKQLQQEEKLKEQEKVKIQRLADALVTYESWKRTKTQQLAKVRKRETEKLKKKEEEEKDEKLRKFKDAEQTFVTWKKTKEAKINETDKRKKQIEEKKSQKALEEKRQKQLDAQKVFESWKKKKEEDHGAHARIIRDTSQQKQQSNYSKQLQREREAQSAYEVWLEQKQRERLDRDSIEFGSRSSLIDPGRPPWLPSNRTIPRGLPPRRRPVRSQSASNLRAR